MLEELPILQPVYPEQPRRVLFLYLHMIDGRKYLHPDYFVDLEEATAFYEKYTGPHVTPLELYEGPKEGLKRGEMFYPYEEPRPGTESVSIVS